MVNGKTGWLNQKSQKNELIHFHKMYWIRSFLILNLGPYAVVEQEHGCTQFMSLNLSWVRFSKPSNGVSDFGAVRCGPSRAYAWS